MEQMMSPADRFLHGLAAGASLSTTTETLARAGAEEACSLRPALAAFLLASATQQAAAILFFLWPRPGLLSIVPTGLLLGGLHVWGMRWIVVLFGAPDLLQVLEIERWPVAGGIFPLACALALLVRHLDRAAVEQEAGGGALADPPSV
jgi:hypothetical protein